MYDAVLQFGIEVKTHCGATLLWQKAGLNKLTIKIFDKVLFTQYQVNQYTGITDSSLQSVNLSHEIS